MLYMFNSFLVNGCLWLYSPLSHYSLSDIKVPMRFYFYYYLLVSFLFFFCTRFRPGCFFILLLFLQ
ncbi:hypothetical protein J3Q64DRAFT_1765628 [Phycomyces blakesleeanus]|uniref:Uncharacterized protein n=1 Tax=Phycomyces blakesleeanus TaxID=4837 RepID=A0ABR3ANK1_PHYBL